MTLAVECTHQWVCSLKCVASIAVQLKAHIMKLVKLAICLVIYKFCYNEIPPFMQGTVATMDLSYMEGAAIFS